MKAVDGHLRPLKGLLAPARAVVTEQRRWRTRCARPDDKHEGAAEGHAERLFPDTGSVY